MKISLVVLLLALYCGAPPRTASLLLGSPHSSRSNLAPFLKASTVDYAVLRETPFVPSIRQRRSSSNKSRTSLSMHVGGHSHSHSNHDHHREESSSSSSAKNQQLQRFTRPRFWAMIVFCALTILGPPLIKTKRLAETDIAAFSVTTAALFVMEPLRKYVKRTVRKIRNLGSSIAKHSVAAGGGGAGSFFRTDNAADRVTLLGGVINVVLSTGKFVVGVNCHSSALIADAGHSLSDLFSDFVTLWAVQVARIPPDQDHPYGHGKFEAIGSLFLSLTLMATGVGVGIQSNKKLLEILMARTAASATQSSTAVIIPGFAALAMAFLSVISKEWLFRITRNVGERLNSQVVIANAWHHRSDAYSSVLALVSIGLAMYVPGLLFADAAAGIFVAAMIVMTGAEIMGESIKQLTDTSNEELVQKVTALALTNEDVESVVRVRARHVGSSSTVDVSVAMPEDRPASAARAVEQRLRQQILQQEEGVLDVDVRATTSLGNDGDVICPLLQARINENAVSTSEVESCVRDEIIARHPEVTSVEGVTVHYQDALLVNVDVNIRLDPGASIARAGSIATGIRGTLERSNQINKANIFLDLNEARVEKNQLA